MTQPKPLSERLAEALQLRDEADMAEHQSLWSLQVDTRGKFYRAAHALLPELAQALADADAATDDATQYGNKLFNELTAAKAEIQRLTKQHAREIRDYKDAVRTWAQNVTDRVAERDQARRELAERKAKR